MKIYFHGASGDVTGSAYQLKTKHASVLVDCGLYQGGKEARAKNHQRAKLEGGRVDAVALSHAHFDIVGHSPLLTKADYQSPIWPRCSPSWRTSWRRRAAPARASGG